MKNQAKTNNGITDRQMFEWLKSSPDEWSYKRRLAVWLIVKGRLSAAKAAQIAGVSRSAVWLWVRQYKSKGATGLKRMGRGGRRWGFMGINEETAILGTLIRRGLLPKLGKGAFVKRVMEKQLGRTVSLPYAYRLLQRYSRRPDAILAQTPERKFLAEGTFGGISKPWQRKS